MVLVTLTTDFGHKDYSIAVIKAALFDQIPAVEVVDISHDDRAVFATGNK